MNRCRSIGGVGTLAPVLAGVLPPVPRNMASLMPASWNQIATWLRTVDELRHVT